MYGSGLRVSEAVSLKVSDLDRDRKIIRVRGGKGNKDRQVMFSDALREVLIAYWRWKRPTEWLFPGKKAELISRAKLFSIPAETRRGGPVSTNRCTRIRCGMPSPRIFWTTV